MAKKSSKKSKKSGGEVLVVTSKVKAALKKGGCNMASDALDGLNSYVHWLIMQATKRASQNGRKTVRKHDFLVM